jgi:hypothetical protein
MLQAVLQAVLAEMQASNIKFSKSTNRTDYLLEAGDKVTLSLGGTQKLLPPSFIKRLAPSSSATNPATNPATSPATQRERQPL